MMGWLYLGREMTKTLDFSKRITLEQYLSNDSSVRHLKRLENIGSALREYIVYLGTEIFIGKLR